MDITLYSIGGIVAAVLVFIVFKRVIGLVFRLILVGIIILAVVVVAWWWSKSGDSANDNGNRPRSTQRATDN